MNRLPSVESVRCRAFHSSIQSNLLDRLSKLRFKLDLLRVRESVIGQQLDARELSQHPVDRNTVPSLRNHFHSPTALHSFPFLFYFSFQLAERRRQGTRGY